MVHSPAALLRRTDMHIYTSKDSYTQSHDSFSAICSHLIPTTLLLHLLSLWCPSSFLLPLSSLRPTSPPLTLISFSLSTTSALSLFAPQLFFLYCEWLVLYIQPCSRYNNKALLCLNTCHLFHIDRTYI